MRLAQFILANVDPILAEWEAFAGTLAPGANMTRLALRDDAEAILLASARSMRVDQSLAQQASKSKGHGGADTTESDRLDTASARHGWERVGSGFDITRFNESIDQSLAEAVGSYTECVDRSRQMFLAILGHDLRNPLKCISMGADLVSRTIRDMESVEALSMISTESEAMSQMIKDLIDFASTWLGSSLPLNREPVDLQKACREVVDGFRATHPQSTLHFYPRGDLIGNWDPARLRQVVSNLLDNALKHGSPEVPVALSATSEDSTVVLSVHNEGAPIPPEALPTIFDPLVRYDTAESALRRAPGSIGLGLYIVREIVIAEGGTIEVTSTAEEGTTFTVRIPRQLAVEGDERSDAKAAR